MCRSYRITTWDGLPERLSDLRQYVRRTVGDVDGVDDVELVASELAANAIRHSRSGSPGGSFVLQLVDFSDAWHIRVDDQGGPNSVGPGQKDEDDEAGRGLPVVSALARAWGVVGDQNGRAVWAEVPFPIEEAPMLQEGDVVRVQDEPELSIVVQSPHEAASCLPENTPDIDICCVPVALVRTPTPEEPEGALRWVKASDVRIVTDRCPA